MKLFKINFFILLFISSLFASNDIKELKDLEYGEDSKQKLDMYIPKNMNKKVIFMVHGGAWRIGDKDSRTVVKNKLKYWSKQGYVFITTNYRLVPEANVFEQVNDVAKALKFSQNYLSKYGIDSSDFVIMGHSAGGHLVSLLSASEDIINKYKIENWSSTISIDTGGFDVVDTMNNKHLRLFDKAFGKDRTFWELVSPYHQIRNKTLPFLAVCSSKRDDSCKEALKHINKLKSYGTQVGILEINQNHRQLNKNLGVKGDYTKQVDKFIRKYLK